MLPDNLFPRIDQSRCIGCGKCIEFCPTQALAQRAQKAVLAAPALCTSCRACEDICPSDAIALPFIVVFAPSQVDVKPGADGPATRRRPQSRGGSR
ncbi:MAG: ATP-binding protein [Caldilineaceae bacterium]